MRKLAIWKRDTWFYQNGFFVLISKSEKGGYRYEIFANNRIYLAGNPFRTRNSAVSAAKKCIFDAEKEGGPLKPFGDWTAPINTSMGQ
jgi:uncharacterized protein YegP (UPF0339 family)